MYTEYIMYIISIIRCYILVHRVPAKELSSHITRATIPREGDDREDRRGAVQIGRVGRKQYRTSEKHYSVFGASILA